MILNTQIWNETIETAKAKASSSPRWIRAIERARVEIEKASYWSFDGSTLTIISTTSKKRYVIDDAHTCEARGVCKHLAARRLMVRYTERLSAAPAPSREEIIADIKATWSRKHPRTHLADALMSRFRCNKLEMLNVDFLERIQRALAA